MNAPVLEVGCFGIAGMKTEERWQRPKRGMAVSTDGREIQSALSQTSNIPTYL